MKNVIVIVMDCARHCLIRPELTPFLHWLAENGVSYENHYSTAPWTLPSHATMFTGLYTRGHATEHENMVLPEDVETLAQVMKAKGYHTAAFSNNPWVGPATGLDRGFEHFEGIWSRRLKNVPAGAWLRQKVKKVVMRYSNYLDYRDSGAEGTNERIRRWRSEYDGDERPYFLFVNYMETHAPYRPPEPFRSACLPYGVRYENLEQDFRKINGGISNGVVNLDALRKLCDAEIAYLDGKIEELFKSLDDGNTVWVVTSDHGELFGEDGWVGHRFSLHRNLLHVPMIVYRYGSDVKYSYLTSHIDFFDFVMRLCFFPPRDYVFAEFTNPLQSLRDMGELKEFGSKFDVEKINRDLDCCLNLEQQLVWKWGMENISGCVDGNFKGKEDLLLALAEWQHKNQRRILKENKKVSFDKLTANLRQRGYC